MTKSLAPFPQKKIGATAYTPDLPLALLHDVCLSERIISKDVWPLSSPSLIPTDL
jgi:hypothetical protein